MVLFMEATEPGLGGSTGSALQWHYVAGAERSPPKQSLIVEIAARDRSLIFQKTVNFFDVVRKMICTNLKLTRGGLIYPVQQQ